MSVDKVLAAELLRGVDAAQEVALHMMRMGNAAATEWVVPGNDRGCYRVSARFEPYDWDAIFKPPEEGASS